MKEADPKALSLTCSTQNPFNVLNEPVPMNSNRNITAKLILILDLFPNKQINIDNSKLTKL